MIQTVKVQELKLQNQEKFYKSRQVQIQEEKKAGVVICRILTKE